MKKFWIPLIIATAIKVAKLCASFSVIFYLEEPEIPAILKED